MRLLESNLWTPSTMGDMSEAKIHAFILHQELQELFKIRIVGSI